MTSSKVHRIKLVGILALSLIAVLALAHWTNLGTTHAAGPGAGMSLNVPNALSCTTDECSVDVTQPFLLTISTNPTLDFELSGFATEVVFPTESLNWNQRATCEDEVQVGRQDGSSLQVCIASVSTLLLGASHGVVSQIAEPPLAALTVAPGSTTLLVEMDFSCKTVGTFDLTLTAAPDSRFGSVYGDLNARIVEVKTIDVDFDGDTEPNAVADTLTINCEMPPPTPTPTETPVPPTNTPGGPTDTPVLPTTPPGGILPTPEPTETPGPIGAVVAGFGGIDDNGGLRTGLWAVIGALLVAVGGGLAIFGGRSMSLARVATAAPGMIVGHELAASGTARSLGAQQVCHRLPMRQSVQMQVQGVEGFSALVDALRALSRTPGITKARAVSLGQGDAVFEVTLSAPTTGQELARAVSATLERPVRIEEHWYDERYESQDHLSVPPGAPAPSGGHHRLRGS